MSQIPTEQENPGFVSDPGAERWITALKGYLEIRSSYLDIDDADAMMRWLWLQEQRKRIPMGTVERRRSPDAFGLGHPSAGSKTEWQVAIASDDGQALGVGRIESVGKEALVLSIPFDLNPDRTYRITLRTHRSGHRGLRISCLWQARVLVNRWRVGAVVLSVD